MRHSLRRGLGPLIPSARLRSGNPAGLALGAVLGISLTRALSGQGITELVVPGGRLVLFLALGALIGVLAAVWPARRAARMKVLDAIATA
jgi:putative ABC transport system permease protein